MSNSDNLEHMFAELEDLVSFDSDDATPFELKAISVDQDMEVEYADPRTLKQNPWNPNVVDPINQMKLEHSIEKDGVKRPIVVRTLEDGTLEIIGGQHRTLAAISLNMDVVPVINRGLISDAAAKKETLIDNFRYGTDDILKFSHLLQDPDIGSADELLATMPIDEEELAGYFSHLTAESISAEVDALLDDSEADEGMIDLGATTPARTHQIIRFRVSMEDSAKLSELFNRVKVEQGFTESDDMTNDGDALVHLLSDLTKR